jgi:pilus assembly protein Flp/PilA
MDMLDKKLSEADVSGVKRLGGRGNVTAGAVEFCLPCLFEITAIRFPWSETILFVPSGTGGSNIRGRTMKTFINMLRDDRGASAAEYALILAIIGAVIALAALGLADAIGNAMNDTAACISNPTTGVC